MPGIGIKRNWKGIPDEELRRKVDPLFNALHDRLHDCYYNYWRYGKSKPFFEWDVQATPEESKALFDKLHGLIFHWRDLAMSSFKREDNQIPAVSKEKIKELREEGIDLLPHIKEMAYRLLGLDLESLTGAE